VQADRQIADDGAEAPWQARLVVRAGLLELIVAASLALVALWLWIGSYSFARGEGGLSGAVAFPRGVSIILGGACLLLAYRGARQMARRQWKGTAEPVSFRRPRAVLGAAVLIILYPILLSHFGFYAATGPWLLALLWVVGQRNPVWGIVTMLGFLVAVKLAFQMAMGIPLP
jgi:Tripartite tricarboxylate transporter TctB family